MFMRGLTGLGVTAAGANSSLTKMKWKVAEINSEESEQRIEINLSYEGYEDFAVKRGIPVVLVINAEEDFITGCNKCKIGGKYK